MVSSNIQRDIILYSETASACKMMLESIKRQGKRTDLTSPKLLGKLKNKEAADIVGEVFGISGEMVRHRIHLLNLIPDILDMVDAKKFSITSAFEISHLPNEAQQILCTIMERNKRTPSLSQAKELRKRAEECSIDAETINSIMREEKFRVELFKIPKERITRFFTTKTTTKEMEDTIVEALEFFQFHQRNQGE